MKTKPKTTYQKYRTFILPKEMVDLLLVTSNQSPLNSENRKAEVTIGLSIINEIITKSSMFNRDEDYPFHCIPMHSKYLKLKYGDDYSPYLKWLVIHSVLWKDFYHKGYSNHYYLQSIPTCVSLIKSKLMDLEEDINSIITTYCVLSSTNITLEIHGITDSNADAKDGIFYDWYRIQIPIDKENKRYLTTDYEKDSKYINNSAKHLKKMGSYFRNIDIDYEAAINHTRNRFSEQVLNAINEDYKYKAHREYSSRIATIHQFVNGRMNKTLRFHRNSTNNRLDTNLTNMASDLRPFIVGFKDMVNLDLVNSQPVLFNVMLRSYRKNASDEELKELDLYLESTTSGNWYETIMEIYGIDRAKAKKIWMELAYSKNSSYKSEKNIFKKEFPFIYKIIEDKKEKYHAAFSVELQKIESKVFIDKICKDLVGEGIIPLTLHDGLLVPKKDMERTKEIMLSNLVKVIGREPQINVE
ncbi:hypothetical protein [Flavobacterium tegetincola]|uniref:hypothetical protein n=1 Tax=Flavobacterium tegetincola TaxID=150172 RepID=UPI0004085D39|nr:hypothetical protein [Flavobacterium tegetincola]